MSIEIVGPEERETTRDMIRRLIEMEQNEPPQDAGQHPSYGVHEQVGQAWADWDRERRAWVTLIAPRLLAEAKGDVFTASPETTNTTSREAL